MYHVSQFLDRHITAFSVPPSAHADLSDDFQELSRIHFYLGRVSIDHMLKAVEDSSLENIEKGKIQLFFATKEIQEFLLNSWHSLDTFSTNSLEPSIYFQKTFDNTFKHTLEILESAYKKPTKKQNLEMIETMIGLTHESQFLSDELSKIGIQTNVTDKVEEIKAQYNKVLNLKPNYDNLSPLKEFSAYEEGAKESVREQLKTPFEFNYSEMAKHVYHARDDDWMPTLHYLLKEREKMDTPDYKFKTEDSQKLKDMFLKHVKSFNQLFKNGVVNYVNSYSAAIGRETFVNIEKTIFPAESYFQRALSYHEDNIKRKIGSLNYHKEEIHKLLDKKEEIIQQKTDDKTFYEQYLTLLYRQEKNISQAFNKIRANIFNLPIKETVTFEGDIKEGFVVGTFSNADKVILIHKDKFVEVPEAVYAMVISKDKYEDLINNNKLIYNKELRDAEFSNASNFYSYGQFLQEITEPSIQNFFLGQQFDLIDKTTLDLKSTTKKPKI